MTSVYKAMGTAVTLSLCRKLYQLDLSVVFASDSVVKFGMFNFLLILGYLIGKRIVILTFGRQFGNIRKRFYESLQYTVFQCIFLSFFAKNYSYLMHLAMLTLLKNFHYVVELNKKYSTHVILLIIDLMLILKIKYEKEKDLLILLFNYEILQLFQLNLLQLLNMMIEFDKQAQKLCVEFGINFVSFNLSLCYLYHEEDIYLFVQLLPLIYKIFRLLLIKTKNLITYLHDEQQFKKYDKLLQRTDKPNNQCFCFENNNDLRKLNCGHTFHFDCVKKWLVKSKSCPFCRDEL